MKLFLAPHNDDEALFGAFTILREHPVIVIVTDSYVQQQRGGKGTASERRRETLDAMNMLLPEPQVVFLSERDDRPDFSAVARFLQSEFTDVEAVYAPAIEEGGHAQHNAVGMVAKEVFPGKVTHYMTYTNRGKSQGIPVHVEPHWPMLKLKALACYESQIMLPATQPHFMRDLWEYYQP